MANIFESTAPQPGQRATESTHRKIELQSPADLTYLIANVSAAAREKLNKHFPPDAVQGEDELRGRVEGLVDEYIRNTFNGAKDSISINGMDRAELEAELAKAQEGEELEPFDTRLAQRIQTLSTQVEHQTLALANLRRKAPQDTAAKFTASYEKQVEEYEGKWKLEQERRLQEAKAVTVDVGSVERVEEVAGTWRKGNEGLEELKRGLGGSVAGLEKATRAVGVVGEKR
ncbi:unnamed protein product [Zymoseptoria tritici ST99CH_1E4]|uniref:Kinetochore protein mis14 n=1 Tax=Zymoseptoria tritici ST99CH_1E4 TaxID=1276532 RepID=A0A2H1GLQ0_ZYMTR|nr:unnamed protein product [Zymoseptoria tritici ST99CH_1E4]